MNDVTVKCRDEQLTTLIVNELTRIFISAGRAGDCRLLITDADRPGGETVSLFTVGVSRAPEQEAHRFDAMLRRPLLMSELRETVLRLLDAKEPEGNADNFEIEFLSGGTVRYCGREVSLTDTEYRLLGYLADRRGESVDRETLKRELDLAGNAVDVYVCYLRRKLTYNDRNPIATLRGRGYMLK